MYVAGRGGIHSLDDDSIQIDFARVKYLTLRGRIFGWGARCLDKIMKVKGVMAHPMCRGRGFGRLRRNVSRCNHEATDAGMRNPITGIAGCCARAESGHAAAAPPSSDMNSRRLLFGASCGSSDFNMITEISDAVGESGRGRQARSPRLVGDSRTGRDLP